MTTRLLRRFFAFVLTAVLCCSFTVTAWAKNVVINYNDSQTGFIGTKLYVGDKVIFNGNIDSSSHSIGIYYYKKFPDDRITDRSSPTSSSSTVELTIEGLNISNLKYWVVRNATIMSTGASGQHDPSRLELYLEAVLVTEQPATTQGDNTKTAKKSETHTTPSWVLNPNEKQQLVAVLAGLGDGMTIGYQEQGDAAKNAIKGAMPAGFVEAFEFNILNSSRQPEMTLKQGTVTLMIPAEYRKPGRQFRLIALTKGGKTILYSDTDNDPGTITVNLNHTGYAFSLIYKD